jgi:hypothetical protein
VPVNSTQFRDHDPIANIIQAIGNGINAGLKDSLECAKRKKLAQELLDFDNQIKANEHYYRVQEMEIAHQQRLAEMEHQRVAQIAYQKKDKELYAERGDNFNFIAISVLVVFGLICFFNNKNKH